MDALKNKKSQNYINHIGLLLDKSYSMYRLVDQVIQVVDDLIAHLAQRSKELDQETRVTVYVFDDTPKCVIYDKDVLRLPSVREFYRASGNTALIDATLLSISDLRLTPQKYGDHAFLTYVFTDGQENASSKNGQYQITSTLTTLNDNETVAVLVPDQHGVAMAKRYGFPADNVAIWEVSAKGLTEVATKITKSADTFMTSRTQGVRSSKTIFSMDLGTVNKATVNSKTLVSLDRDAYLLLDVKTPHDGFQIRDFVEEQGHPYKMGKAYYQLTKTEKIQPQKNVALQNIHSGRIYTGPQARDLLGLSDQEDRVKPDGNPEYRVYIQSTSVNRKLVQGTKLLLLK